jgi:hypothetical protein
VNPDFALPHNAALPISRAAVFDDPRQGAVPRAPLKLLRIARLRLPVAAADRLILLIAVTLALRIIFAAVLGLGVDESYMVAAGRRLQLSYYDHPPIAWWLAWAASHLMGSEAPLVVRTPFLLLFAGTTVLMYRATAWSFGREAGLWAAVALNLCPVFGLAVGSWVLPDGPLLACLLGALVCLQRALPAKGTRAWTWWVCAGACAGLGLCSKYTAILTLAGAVFYLLSEPKTGRTWLTRPHPYAAGLLAALLFSPVVVWNSQHHWASFAFQGGRGGGRFHVLGPLVSLAGPALILLPWLWAMMILCGVKALGRGRKAKASWLMVCLAAPPILTFVAIALWAHVLPHWATPGYLFLLPLVGDRIARGGASTRWMRLGLKGTAGLLGAAALAACTLVQTGAWPSRIGSPGSDLDIAAQDWRWLKTDARFQALANRPHTAVAALRWFDAGKIDYALGGTIKVTCLSPDARQYGLLTPLKALFGDDLVIVAPRTSLAAVKAKVGALFDSIEPVSGVGQSATVHHLTSDGVFLGRRLHLFNSYPRSAIAFHKAPHSR